MRRFRTWLGPRRAFLAAVLLVGAASAAGLLVMERVAPTNLVMLYLLAVVIAGLRWGQSAAVLASVLGVLAFDFFLVPPYLTFHVADAGYFITFAALLGVALVIGALTGQLRDHAAMLRRREAETAALYEFSRAMAVASDLPAVTGALVSRVREGIGEPAVVALPENGRLALHGDVADLPLDDGQLAEVRHVLDTGESLGWAVSSDLGLGLIPLRTARGSVGVLVLRWPRGRGPIGPGQQRLVEAFASQAAVLIERLELAEAARRAELLEEAEKLHAALLHSVSHALRTPLASIIGSLSALTDPSQSSLDPATRSDLLATAREEAERLNGLVGNLLDMTRLESGHLKLTVDWHDLEDVIGVAISQTAAVLQGRPTQVRIPEQLPLIALDHMLIVQVLDNLLTNAAKYSPPGSAIDIAVLRKDRAVDVQVADRGPGIPAGELERVFEKFYRLDRPGQPAGTGLGLAICRGIVEAHGGRTWAEHRAGGGTVVTLTLPLRPVPESGAADAVRPE